MTSARAICAIPAAAVLMFIALATTSFGQTTDPVALSSPPDNRPIVFQGSILAGAYDPQGNYNTDTHLQIEHLFMPWLDIDLSTLPLADDYARQRGRSLLITIEPWTWSERKKGIPPKDLLDGIMAGRYTGAIAAICSTVGQLKSPTVIRWAQEMENESGRFSWQRWRPKDYQRAYRKFVDQCRSLAPNAKYMWSPKGGANLADYYPGDDVVDEIGLSVFGLQAYDREVYGHDRTFAEILKPGYDAAVKLGKPIYVAELGYVGDAEYVHNWARSALLPYPEFPELKGAVYFNDKEVWEWPRNLGLPDWRVTSNIVE